MSATTNDILNTAATNTTSGRTAAGTRTEAEAQKGLNSNYQDFLKLLTTQLQNQDPTQPADTNQLTQQIASLSQVEQLINSNSKLEQLVALFGSIQANNAVAYIGKQIDAAGNQIELHGGAAALVYDLPGGASSVDVAITNAAGQTVFSGSGTTIAGRNQVLWNGINSVTGQTMPEGAYNFTVTPKDAAGKALTATTFTTGIVTAVETQNGTTSLSLGDISVPLASVQSVYTAGANPGA